MPSVLRLSLFNPHAPDHPVAERELALRLMSALSGMGWDGEIHSHSGEVEAYGPDAVINLYPEAAPKLTDHPWLACAWNPVSLVARLPPPARAGAARHLPAHDAYLVSGPVLEAHVGRLMQQYRRESPRLPFHPSSPRSTLAPGIGPQSRLFYIGSNWDGQRYPALLRRLADAGALALHGTAARWSHLPQAYQGPLPFDGRSVIAAAHHWGMGLCLHLPQHRAEGVPNMRVFELAAAGALIIADRHPFIEQWFGDRVLYVDTGGGEEAAAAAILEQVAWAQAHRGEARAMAAEAQTIFNRHLCLEALLEPLPDFLAGLQAARTRTLPARRLGVLLPDGQDKADRLALLARQQSDGLSLTVLLPGEDDPGLPAGLDRRVLTGPAGMAGLRAGLAGLDGLVILPAGITWPANHLARLAAALADCPAGAMLAPGLWPRPPVDTGFPLDPREQWALIPRPGDAVPAGRDGALALIWAGGLCCRVDRLDGLDLPDHRDWLSLALELGPLLAGAPGGVELLDLPGPRLTALTKDTSPVLSWPTTVPETAMAGPARPVRLTGLSDLAPELAEGVPFLWQVGDFADLPEGPIWLYGAGRGGELVLAALPGPVRARLAGFLDSSRQGTAHGLPLCRPHDLEPADLGRATVIIAAQYVSDILRALRRGPVPPARILNAYPYIAARLEAGD